MDLDHLPGESGAQVAAGAVHDAQQSGNVVGQLRPASPTGIIDRREVVFEADAGAHRRDRHEDARQNGMLGVVLSRVVGSEESTAVEEQAARPLTAADDVDRVGGVPPLRPDLTQILRPAFDMLGAQPLRAMSRVPNRSADSARGHRAHRPGETMTLRTQISLDGSRATDPGRRTQPHRCWYCAFRRQNRSR